VPIYGKIPPQAKELEESVLGAIILEGHSFEVALDIIPHPDCFYTTANQNIYKAILNLHQKGIRKDLLTVTEEMRNLGTLDASGGPYYIAKLTMNVVSSAHVEAHCRIVMEKFMLRELAKVSGDMLSRSYGTEDVFDLLDEAEISIAQITSGNIQTNYFGTVELANEALISLENLINNPRELSGVTTGFSDMNATTSGWQDGNLIVLAARPSMGKTALALSLSINAAKAGFGVGFFSLEMSRQELVKRVLSEMSGTPLKSVQEGRLSPDEFKDYQKSAEAFSNLNIKIDESSSPTVQQIRSKARRMVVKDGVKLIIVDYLQLMKGSQSKNGNREQEVAQISVGLKNLAKELKVPVIALAQLNRGIEARGNKTPMLSDLRESGAIEQDADIVAFIYGDRVGDKDADTGQVITSGNIPRFVKFAKNRNGTCDTVELTFNGDIQRFTGTEQQSFQQFPVPIPENPTAGMQHAINRFSPKKLPDDYFNEDALPFS